MQKGLSLPSDRMTPTSDPSSSLFLPTLSTRKRPMNVHTKLTPATPAAILLILRIFFENVIIIFVVNQNHHMACVSSVMPAMLMILAE